MNPTWFRFYNEVATDAKVQMLPPVLFKGWVNLLCLASNNSSNRGYLPELKEVAYTLHLTTIRVDAIIKELVDAKLIEWRNGQAYMHNWNGRQFQSDVSTDRVKRFRNAQRNVSETVVETDQTRTDTEQIRTDPPISPQEFETRWAQYPAKDGKIAAQRHWKASVKTPQDLQDYDRSFANYLVHLKVSGYPPKNGSTFFNNWRDFVDWKEPILAKPSKDAIPAFARPSVEAIEQQEQEVMREYREIMGQA